MGDASAPSTQTRTAAALFCVGWIGLASLISAVEVIYRDLCKPESVKPKAAAELPQTPNVTRENVDKILAHERSATLDGLQYVVQNAKHFDLTPWQRDKIALQMTIAISAKMRQAQGAREDPTWLLLRSMGVLETPGGLLCNVERFVAQLRAATRAIMECRDHHPPRCGCWRSQRDWLYEVRTNYGEQSPESYAALQVWNTLEEIEQNAKFGSSVL